MNFFYQCNWMQLKDPAPLRGEIHSRRRLRQGTCTSTGWIGLRSVPSPAYRDLNNPKYQKLIRVSFTNSKKERDYIKTSNHLYGRLCDRWLGHIQRHRLRQCWS